MNDKFTTLSEIKKFIIDNKAKVSDMMSDTVCKKWDKLKLDDTTHIYPCVCPVRNSECIFLDTYYELNRVIEIHNKESFFKAVVYEFRQIQEDSRTILLWQQKYKYEALLSFNCEVKIMLELAPYKTLKIKLSEEGFENFMEFKKIYNKLEYKKY